MGDAARENAVKPPNPLEGTIPPRLRRGRLIMLGTLGLVVVALVVVFGSYYARRSFIVEQNIYIVTAESLSHYGNFYGGGDHPLNPQVGDRYVGSSGCNTSEIQCTRQITLLSTRLVC